MHLAHDGNTTINRLIWIISVILFGALGAAAGWAVGDYYVERDQIAQVIKNPALRNLVIATLTFGMAIVSARIGSWLADRFLIVSLGRFHTLSAVDRVLGIIGVLIGLLFGVLITLALPNSPGWWLVVKLVAMSVSAIIGMAMFQGMRADMLRVFPQLEPVDEAQDQTRAGGAMPKLLDTNVIIDGRLAEVCKTGFIEGPLYVPRFVLEEVQYIADSSDAMRRVRGRRGLDILNAMREQMVEQKVNGEIEQVAMVHVMHDIPAHVQRIDAVDSKLVALAHEMHAAIITNDFNLNRVAELQEIKVLNINELAGALKPVVLPGEEMELFIAREGKEPDQGVGYLDDGTMVVVSGGQKYLGETKRIVINQLHQTVAGKMIFAEMKTMKGAGDDLFGNDSAANSKSESGRDGGSGRSEGGRTENGRSNDSRSGSGMRRKSRT